MAKNKNRQEAAFSVSFSTETLKTHIAQHSLSATKAADQNAAVSAMLGFYVGFDTGLVLIESNNLMLGQRTALHADLEVITLPGEVVWPFGLHHSSLNDFLSVARGDTVKISVEFKNQPTASDDDYPSPTHATLECGSLSTRLPAFNPYNMAAVAETYTSEPTSMSIEDADLVSTMISAFVADPNKIGNVPCLAGIHLQATPILNDNGEQTGSRLSATATDIFTGAHYSRETTYGSADFHEYINPILFLALSKAAKSELIEGTIELGKHNNLVVAKTERVTLCVNTYAEDRVPDITKFLDTSFKGLNNGVPVKPQSIKVSRDALLQALKAFKLAQKDTNEVLIQTTIRQPDLDSDGVVILLTNSNGVNVDVAVEVDADLVSDELSVNEEGVFETSYNYTQLITCIQKAEGEFIVLHSMPYPRFKPHNAHPMIITSDNEASPWRMCVTEFRPAR